MHRSTHSSNVENQRRVVVCCRTRRHVAWRMALLGIGLLLALATRAEALEIDEVVWGFDGKVTPDCFNPLSILVSNRTPNTFDGTLTLQQSLGSNVVDAKLVE